MVRCPSVIIHGIPQWDQLPVIVESKNWWFQRYPKVCSTDRWLVIAQAILQLPRKHASPTVTVSFRNPETCSFTAWEFICKAIQWPNQQVAVPQHVIATGITQAFKPSFSCNTGKFVGMVKHLCGHVLVVIWAINRMSCTKLWIKRHSWYSVAVSG